MVEQRSNLDYGRDDETNEEAGNLPKSDYLTTDRVADLDSHTAADTLTTDEATDEEADSAVNPEASTYGAP
jgi:hypothetical protein